jgi:ribosomal protein S18 acetylase RimI-like enzyme
MTVVRAGLDDLDEVRDIRLRALADAPYAFASTLERELGLTDSDWRQRIERGPWWLARAGDAGPPVGLVAGMVDLDEPADRQLVGMWVDPSARGTPTAGLLVESVLDWARADGAEGVVLWVADGNERAERLYFRMGFTRNGRRAPLASDPEKGEFQMEHRLG